MANLDLDRIRRDTTISETALRYGVALKKNGAEFEACCPFHSENTPSFTVFRGKDGAERFQCFGCGERGDVLDFVMKIQNVTLREAGEILGGAEIGERVAPRQVEAVDPYAGIEWLRPVSRIEPGKRVRLFNPKRASSDREWGSFAPSRVFLYEDHDGPLGYVLRHDLPDGGKETPMVMWVRLPNGDECWCRFPFPKPRPLYGLLDLPEDGQVIIVEGEKCRDEYRRVSKRACVSWPGGTYGINHVDWSPLYGRKVVIWPDADRPGGETADKLAAMLHENGCSVKILEVAA